MKSHVLQFLTPRIIAKVNIYQKNFTQRKSTTLLSKHILKTIYISMSANNLHLVLIHFFAVCFAHLIITQHYFSFKLKFAYYWVWLVPVTIEVSRATLNVSILFHLNVIWFYNLLHLQLYCFVLRWFMDIPQAKISCYVGNLWLATDRLLLSQQCHPSYWSSNVARFWCTSAQ